MISEELLNNYKKALQQKYNAVCFDIDGTLTENNSTKIDSRVLPILANMLKKHIPVVFITGRGETGLNDLLSDIIYLVGLIYINVHLSCGGYREMFGYKSELKKMEENYV